MNGRNIGIHFKDFIAPLVATLRGIPKSAAERWFLALGIPFGLAYVIITPPFQTPDEQFHFYHAYALSEGKLIAEKRGDTTGAVIPNSCITLADVFVTNTVFRTRQKVPRALIDSMFALPLRSDDARFTSFAGSAVFSPVVYVPEAAAVGIVRLFDPPALTLIYAARAAGLAAFLLLMFTAIRITPVFKWAFLITALTPMALYIGASPSADNVTNGIAYVFTAFVLLCAFGPDERLPKVHLAVLVGLGVLLALCKTGYVLLFFLILLIPARKLGGRKQYWLFALFFFVVTIGVTMAWAKVATAIFSSAFGEKIDPQAATQFILHHPSDFAVMVMNNLFRYGEFYLNSYVGYLGWLDVLPPATFLQLYFVIIVLVALFSGNSAVQIPSVKRLMLAGILAGSTLLIITSQYLIFTAVDAIKISPAQGRYFIPLSIPFLLLFHNRKLREDKVQTALRVAVPVLIILALGICLYYLIERYYLA